jgi:hypothetical protein
MPFSAFFSLFQPFSAFFSLFLAGFGHSTPPA